MGYNHIFNFDSWWYNMNNKLSELKAKRMFKQCDIIKSRCIYQDDRDCTEKCPVAVSFKLGHKTHCDEEFESDK
jgi:hypothetical protein